MKITREEVLRVAELAHLELSPEEVELYCGQLDEILSYISKLQELDVTQVEPVGQTIPRELAADLEGGGASLGSRPDGSGDDEPNLRDDVIVPCNIGEEVLAHAPDAAVPFFRVPRVIER